MIDRLSDLWAGLVMRHHSGTRISFYEGFQNLVENGMSSNDALKELNQIWSYGGKKPHEPLAIVTRDLMIQLMEGFALSRGLSRWVPYEEASLVAAGERGGSISQACDDVIRVIEAKQQIRGAVASAVAYPTFLIIPLTVLLWMVANKLIPKMAQVSNPESWTGSAYALYALANFVTRYGLFSVCLLLILITLFLTSLSRWTGPARRIADRGPFYATYRMVHGSTFLLNLAVMMRAGIPTNSALEILGEYASPWLRERLAAARHGLAVGSNLGVALDNAEFNFPDKKAIQFIRILASRDGFPEALNRYSVRWLATSVKQLQQLAKVAFAVAMLLMGTVMGLVVDGTQDMQNNFESSASHRVSH